MQSRHLALALVLALAPLATASRAWAAPEAPAPEPTAAARAAAETPAPETIPPAPAASHAAATEPPSVPAPDPPPAPAVAPEPAITKLPVLVRQVEPVYPDAARAAGIEAVVVLDLDIDASGKIESVAVVTPAAAAGQGFEDAAVAAAWQLEFQPAEADGVPIPVRITYKYAFTLTPAAPTTSAPRPAVVNFEGRLVERGTRLPLAGLRVTVFRAAEDAPAFEALSDQRGHFAFFDLDAGDWRVLVEADGYYPFRTTETVVAGERLEATYHVERRSYNPYDVLVEASRPRKEVTRRTIAVEEIEKVPGTFGDPVAVVTNLPSVARPPMGLGMLIVRGSSPEDTRIAVEGVTVPQVYHFGALRSVLPTGMIQMLDFYPGNFGPQYGRANGGFLDVRLKKLSPERVGGYLDVNVMDTGLYVEAPVGKDAAVAVAVRRSYLDLVLSAAIPSDATVSFATAPRYYDSQLLATWQPTRSQRLEAFFFLSDDVLELVAENPGDMDTSFRSGRLDERLRFFRGVVAHHYTPAEGFENALTLSAGKDATLEQLGDQFLYDVGVWSLQVRDELRARLGERLALTAGVDYVAERYDATVRSQGLGPMKEGDAAYWQSPDTIETEIDGEWSQYPGAYLEAEWRPLRGLSLLPGLRVDRLGATGDLVFDPRFTMRWELGAMVTAKAAVGVFHQEPLPDELDAGWGNPDLDPERAVHWALGAELRPLERLGVDVTAFYKQMDSMVGRSSAMVERDGQLVPERYSSAGEGRVYGIDLMVRQELWHDFFGWIAYTLSRSERRDPGAKDWRLFDHDQTHVVTAVASYRLPRNWELGLRWRYVTGSPYTPITGAVYAADFDTFRPVSGRLNSARLGPYHQLDVRIDKRWVYDGWMLDAYVDLQNAYGRSNPEAYSYAFDYSRKEPVGGLPIMPVIGLRAEL